MASNQREPTASSDSILPLLRGDDPVALVDALVALSVGVFTSSDVSLTPFFRSPDRSILGGKEHGLRVLPGLACLRTITGTRRVFVNWLVLLDNAVPRCPLGLVDAACRLTMLHPSHRGIARGRETDTTWHVVDMGQTSLPPPQASKRAALYYVGGLDEQRHREPVLAFLHVMAEEAGWTVLHVFMDDGPEGRPELGRLIGFAASGGCDVLLLPDFRFLDESESIEGQWHSVFMENGLQCTDLTELHETLYLLPTDFNIGEHD